MVTYLFVQQMFLPSRYLVHGFVLESSDETIESHTLWRNNTDFEVVLVFVWIPIGVIFYYY